MDDGTGTGNLVDFVTRANRRSITPGIFTDATTFIPTDMSAEASNVQAFAAQQWTQAVVAAYKAAFPFVPTPAPTAEQLRLAAYKADPTRQNLITLIQGSTPAQINNWLTTNVTTLAQARAVLGQLILLVAGANLQ